jgi:hypothetical protein
MAVPRIRVLDGAISSDALMGLRDVIWEYTKRAVQQPGSTPNTAHHVIDDVVWSLRMAIREYFKDTASDVLESWTLNEPLSHETPAVPAVAGRMIEDIDDDVPTPRAKEASPCRTT